MANLVADYSTRAFYLFHDEIQRTNPVTTEPHDIRGRYWQAAPHREYELWEARDYLLAYMRHVERALADALSLHSIAYWLHVYRRLYPGAIGVDSSPMTTGLTRAVLEAAIQKYAMTDRCYRIAISTEVPVSDVLKGLLMGEDFRPERESLEASGGQLVLTDFGPQELREVYDAEKLAYEIWRGAATLRSTAKGGRLLATPHYPYFEDRWDDDLEYLIRIFDSRHRNHGVSTAAVVYDESGSNPGTGVVFLPTYNLGGVDGGKLQGIFENLTKGKVNLSSTCMLNFIWLPFKIRDYLLSHRPFDAGFRDKYGISLAAVLLVVASLGWRAFFIWSKSHGGHMLRYWQRAYEGPLLKSHVFDEIIAFKSPGQELLGLSDEQVTNDELAAAIEYWTLPVNARQEIDLAYSGKHYLFLPFEDDRLFIDYAWLQRRFYDFFVGVHLSDQNFKGDALEELVRNRRSFLPTSACRATDGTSKQIDAAYLVRRALIIAECKAVARSIGFDRGDPEAIDYRKCQVIDRALREADEKARWLASHPIGANYSLENVDLIIPIGISPFVEYIHTRDSYYWIDEETPRVLTPWELSELLAVPEEFSPKFNIVTITR